MCPPPDQPLVVFLAPMTSELAPLVKAASLRAEPTGHGTADGAAPSNGEVHTGTVGRARVVAHLTGIGTAAATEATRRALDSAPVAHVVVTGIAGGVVAAGTKVGDLVVPATVVDETTGASYEAAPLGGVAPAGALSTSDEFVVDPVRLAAYAERGIGSLDMETASVAAVCAQRGVPWTAFRSISDVAEGHPVGEAVMKLVGADGRPRAWASLRYVLTHPWRVPALMRLGKDAQRAARSAARAAVAAVEAQWPRPTSTTSLNDDTP